MAPIFTIYDCNFRLRQKGVIFTKSISLAAEFIYLATSTECAGPISRPTAIKGLRSNLLNCFIQIFFHQYFCRRFTINCPDAQIQRQSEQKCTPIEVMTVRNVFIQTSAFEAAFRLR